MTIHLNRRSGRMHVCKNQKCGKAYAEESATIDDGFCSFDCWETANCEEPKPEEMMEEEFA